jgi:hypothetical protein
MTNEKKTIHSLHFADTTLIVISILICLTVRLTAHKHTNSQKMATTVIFRFLKLRKKLNSVDLVRERTVPTERPSLVDEIRANFCR